MADSFHYFRRLFQEEPTLASGKILISRPIEYLQDDLEDYQAWLKSDRAQQMFQWISRQYQIYTSQKHTSDDGIDFFDRITGCGLIIHAGHTELEFSDFFYLLLFLKNQLGQYHLKKGEVTVSDGSYMAETRYTYVLESPSDPHEITLQLLKKDEFPVQLRIDVKNLAEDTAAIFLKELIGSLFGQVVVPGMIADRSVHDC